MSSKSIKVGDRVRFLNDVGGGKVLRIIDQNSLTVETQDGFEVPVLQSEVVLVDVAGESTIKLRLTEEKNRPGVGKQQQELDDDAFLRGDESSSQKAIDEIDFSTNNDEPDPDGDDVGLYLAFVPVDQSDVVSSDHNLYIINDSPYRVFFSVGQWVGDSVTPVRSGFLYPDTKELVHCYKRDELNNELVISIQSLLFKNTHYTPQQPEYMDLEVNPRKFYKAGCFVENDFFEENALIYTIVDSTKEALLKSLSDDALENALREKEAIMSKSVELKPITQDLEEVDLHIHELVENHTLLTPGEILEIQLARFKISLEGAIKSKTRRIVFIHGVGNGKLKQEIRKALEKEYPKLRYQDASFREYGYGATMVILRK